MNEKVEKEIWLLRGELFAAFKRLVRVEEQVENLLERISNLENKQTGKEEE